MKSLLVIIPLLILCAGCNSSSIKALICTSDSGIEDDTVYIFDKSSNTLYDYDEFSETLKPYSNEALRVDPEDKLEWALTDSGKIKHKYTYAGYGDVITSGFTQTIDLKTMRYEFEETSLNYVPNGPPVRESKKEQGTCKYIDPPTTKLFPD